MNAAFTFSHTLYEEATAVKKGTSAIYVPLSIQSIFWIICNIFLTNCIMQTVQCVYFNHAWYF